MALFSSSFSFGAPSTRPDSLYTLDTPLDNISPTSSRCGSPSSPTASSAPSSSSSSTDDIYGLTSHLSSSSLYTSSRFMPPGRRSPPRSTPFTLPPNSSQPPTQFASDLLVRRERRQAYVADQLSCQSRRKLSLLVARMLRDEISGSSRRHPNDGLHPSNVRVVPAMPGVASRSGSGGSSSSRRNTLAEVVRPGSSNTTDEEAEDSMGSGEDNCLCAGRVCESIELDLPVRSRESANRISKRGGGRLSGGRKSLSRAKK